MNIKSVCVVGVDGTGKSSTINMLRDALGADNVIIQYMGARLWETKIAKKYIESNKPESFFRSIMIVIAYPIEMFHRVKKHRKTHKIVIFDRYVDEQVIIRKAEKGGVLHKAVTCLYGILFKYLLYKPTIVFYLNCPIEISITRKTDIQTEYDKDRLKKNKELLDDYYNKVGAHIIDTSNANQSEVVDRIVRVLKESRFLL